MNPKKLYNASLTFDIEASCIEEVEEKIKWLIDFCYRFQMIENTENYQVGKITEAR